MVAVDLVKAGNDPPPISFRGQKSTIDRIYCGASPGSPKVKLIIFIRFKAVLLDLCSIIQARYGTGIRQEQDINKPPQYKMNHVLD